MTQRACVIISNEIGGQHRGRERKREEEEAHKETHHPTQLGRLDVVNQRSYSAFVGIMQSWKDQFLQLLGLREMWEDLD